MYGYFFFFLDLFAELAFSCHKDGVSESDLDNVHLYKAVPANQEWKRKEKLKFSQLEVQCCTHYTIHTNIAVCCDTFLAK